LNSHAAGIWYYGSGKMGFINVIRGAVKVKRIAVIFFCLMIVFLVTSCKANDASGIPSDIEVVHGVADKITFENLKQVEDDATIIVEAVARKTIGQKVSTHYDTELQKDLPMGGYTQWEIEVTKVNKGDVKEGDKLVLLQDYYLWTYSDGKEQLITATDLKPAVKNKKYLMFLKYDDRNKGYWPVCDYEGMFAIPTDELKAKVKDGSLKQSDLDVYNYETLQHLVPIYNEVVQKYFK